MCFCLINFTGFVEDEANLSYPDNGHLTQILWRATRYVGCADAVRPYDGGRCHTQVCRYSKPGKCMSLAYEIIELSTFLYSHICSTFVQATVICHSTNQLVTGGSLQCYQMILSVATSAPLMVVTKRYLRYSIICIVSIQLTAYSQSQIDVIAQRLILNIISNMYPSFPVIALLVF